MTTTADLKKVFEDAFEADHASHKSVVHEVVGEARTLGHDFETVWPKAAPVLVAVTNFIRFIPGLGASAPAISALIAVGNAIYHAENTQPKSAPTKTS